MEKREWGELSAATLAETMRTAEAEEKRRKSQKKEDDGGDDQEGILGDALDDLQASCVGECPVCFENRTLLCVLQSSEAACAQEQITMAGSAYQVCQGFCRGICNSAPYFCARRLTMEARQQDKPIRCMTCFRYGEWLFNLDTCQRVTCNTPPAAAL